MLAFCSPLVGISVNATISSEEWLVVKLGLPHRSGQRDFSAWRLNPVKGRYGCKPLDWLTTSRLVFYSAPVSQAVSNYLLESREGVRTMVRKLPTFRGYTVDLRLKEFRRVPKGHGRIEFVPFDSEKGDELLCEYIKTLDRDGVSEVGRAIC